MKNLIWEHKHRPTNVEDLATQHVPLIVENLKNPSAFPNCLFYSAMGGTGKTTLAKIIINELNADYIMLNSSKDRGIDIVRGKVTDFCSSRSTNPGTKKVVWLDEANKLTKDALDSLKSLIDMYGSYVIFILTTNSMREFEPAFLTRFPLTLDFSNPDKELVVKYLHKICELEEMGAEPTELLNIVDAYYPSVRMMVNSLQLLKSTSTPVREFSKSHIDCNELLFGYLILKDYDVVIKYVVENNIDVVSFNNYLFNRVVSSNYSIILKQHLIKVLADNEINFKMGADPVTIFVASISMLQKLLTVNNGEGTEE